MIVICDRFIGVSVQLLIVTLVDYKIDCDLSVSGVMTSLPELPRYS